jgi:hypothetical protein
MHVVHARRDLISPEQDDHYKNRIRVIGVFFRVCIQINKVRNAPYTRAVQKVTVNAVYL